MKSSKNLVNDLNVLNKQNTKYIENYKDLFNLLDQLVLNKSENINIPKDFVEGYLNQMTTLKTTNTKV